jgi:hypothetical protein
LEKYHYTLSLSHALSLADEGGADEARWLGRREAAEDLFNELVD